MATVIQILADIDARLPSLSASFTEAQKLSWLNDIQRKISKYLEPEATYDFVASSSVEYVISTNIRIENVNRLYTGDSTKIADISSTTVWKKHDYLGEDDTLVGYKYYLPNIEHFNSTTLSTGLCLYPDSTETRVARIYYKTLLSDLTTAAATNVPLWNSEWHDILKYGVLEIIAKSGNDPDIDLANNYAREYRDMLREIKKDQANKKYLRPKVVWNYQNHTWG